jgi:hypothetical protein
MKAKNIKINPPTICNTWGENCAKFKTPKEGEPVPTKILITWETNEQFLYFKAGLSWDYGKNWEKIGEIDGDDRSFCFAEHNPQLYQVAIQGIKDNGETCLSSIRLDSVNKPTEGRPGCVQCPPEWKRNCTENENKD